MKSIVVVLAVAAFAGVHGGEVSPIGKVIQMLGELETKILAEGQAAQKVYDEFAEMCEDRSKDLQFEIKTGKAEVADLKATIESEGATIASLTTKVEELAASIATDEADLKAATEIRQKESTDFSAIEKETTEIIDTLERAIGILKKNGAALLQTKGVSSIAEALEVMVKAASLSSADASKLTALVQSSNDAEDDGAPDASVYENQSGGIVETLGGLLEKAESQLDDARKKETASLNNFEMLKQSLEDEIKFGNKDMAEAKKGIAASSEKKAAAEGDLAATSKELAADVSSLADLHRECMAKAEEFESETKSRGDELKALATAKKIIKETTSGAASQSYDLNQLSFLQVGNFQAVHFVRDLAQKQHSPMLAQLARRMSSAMQSGAGEDVFEKVKGLISDMIEKLEAEAEADATEKAYCDKQLAETHAKKDDKSTEIEKLSTKIDGATAQSAKLKEEVAALQKALGALAASQAQMDNVRQQEKAQYKSDKEEMEMGLDGIKKALKVLRDYYAKDQGTSAQGAGGGIVSLLEVCESDFSKGLAEMIAGEETAQREYDTQSKENEIDKATKEQDVTYKNKEAANLDQSVAELTSDRSGVQEELDAVNEYLSKLEDRCIAKPETYGERTARREAEIAGLKQALEILEGEAVLLQRSTKRTLRGLRKH